MPQVVRALGASVASPVPLPAGAVGACAASDLGGLHALVRRAFQLSRSLPNALLQAFDAEAAALPRETEAERLVVQRVGQHLFRGGLLDYWDGRCAISGLAVPALLRASHIKPWAACDSDAERLDVYNGLLLAPHLDALFDGGYVTVRDDGGVIVSTALSDDARRLLGVEVPLRVRGLAEGHRAYLAWHRAREFERFRRRGAQVPHDGPSCSHRGTTFTSSTW